MEWVEDEAVILNPGTNELHYLSPTAALAYALIEEYGFEKAMEELKARFAPTASIESDMDELVATLVAAGVLVDD